MALTGLLKSELKLLLFGGKGRVGKTTCATSTGLYLAKEGLKILVISTDPAHSLSDSLSQKFGDEIKEVKPTRAFCSQRGMKIPPTLTLILSLRERRLFTPSPSRGGRGWGWGNGI